MASPIGTALMPTQGSCLPLTEIDVFFPNLSIVFLDVRIEDVERGRTMSIVEN